MNNIDLDKIAKHGLKAHKEVEKELTEEFTCPGCGEHCIQRVEEYVTVISQVKIDEDCLEHSWPEVYSDSSSTCRYECTNCDFVLPHEDEGKIIQWLEEQNG